MEDGPAADDYEALTPSKRSKAKDAESKTKAEGQENGQSAALFKIEDLTGNVIDLEQDE